MLTGEVGLPGDEAETRNIGVSVHSHTSSHLDNLLMFVDRRSSLVIMFSLIGSLAVVHWHAQPFQSRRDKQQKLKALGAFAVAFDANGSVSSARLRGLVSEQFPDACAHLNVVDLKEVHGASISLQVLTRLNFLRMVILSGSDVEDKDIKILTRIPGLRHLWLTNTKLTDQCLDDLAKIELLEIVKLNGTGISAEAIERLRLKKPTVRIEGVGSAG